MGPLLGYDAPREGVKTQEDAYFSELLSYPLDRLAKEPELLRADQAQLRRQVQDAAVNGYRAFVDTADCLEGLRGRLQSAIDGLDSLARDLPALQAAAESFRADAAAANTRRADVRRLYANHASLLDLLEVPQLMDTCIRNGNYDEALDLRAFVSKLAVLHGDLPVVQRLVEEAAEASAAMLAHLLDRMQGPIQLPECLRAIGYMRRLAAFSERDLRLQFLQRREAWIADLCAELDDSNAYDFLKRLTDIYRVHLFDVVMQYRAVFSDDVPSANPIAEPKERLMAGSAAARSSLQQQQHSEGAGILQAWAERRTSAYLAAVEAHLPRVLEGGSVASVLDHTMYCGSSLGRVGLDFRPLLSPHFERAMGSLFSRAVEASTAALESQLEGYRWVGGLASRARQQQQQQKSQVEEAALADGGAAGKADPSIPEPPPQSLVDHVPLGVYCNGLLVALNELRHCALLACRTAAAAELQRSLEQVAEILARHGATRALSPTELPVYQAGCRALTTTLCPYVASCFDRVYPGSSALLDLQAVGAKLEASAQGLPVE
jgi:conserved oligomeric Golgi complex subunit 8